MFQIQSETLGKKLGFAAKTLTSFANIMTQMFKMAQNRDLTLIEINPLILTKDNQIIAADSKVVIDGNAEYRQPDIAALPSQRAFPWWGYQHRQQ